MNAYGVLALTKSIDKITVSDICKEANIHRTTFYGHFQDILELESYVIKEQFQRMLISFYTEEGWNLREGILIQMQFYYNNQAMVKRNYQTRSHDRVDTIFSEIVTSTMAESYMKRFNLHSKTEMDYHQTYMTSGFIALISKWIFGGCKESPEEITDIVCKLIEGI